MKVLVVEDDRKIKSERIDDILTSLGHESDWAQHQQEARELLAANHYDLILLDLQIPSRPGGKDLAEFGKNLLKQIRTRTGRDRVPVILMTAQYQRCVDLMTELNDLGLDGSIAKPFPESGRTLAVVMDEVMEKHRRFRQRLAASEPDEPLRPFTGGVMEFYPDRVELCGEVIAVKSGKGHAWRILHMLRETNERGLYVRIGSTHLAAKLRPRLAQNTPIQSIKALRERIASVMKERLGLECDSEDVVANGGQGYHLRDWIVVEEHDEVGTSVGAMASANCKQGIVAAERFGERQRWVLDQLASDVKLTRRDIQEQFDVSDRTAKRDLAELSEANLIEYDRSEHPGFYRLK
ncbi:MAG: response regulator [Pirellulales bacterium]